MGVLFYKVFNRLFYFYPKSKISWLFFLFIPLCEVNYITKNILGAAYFLR